MLTYAYATYPATRPIRTTEPTWPQEPLSIEQARKQVGMGDGVDYHDDDLKDWVTTARRTVEHDTVIAGYTGSFTWNITEFPCSDRIPIYGIRPVTAIGSITYIDTAGATQTWSSAQYALKNKSLVPSIYLNYGYVWPVVRGDQEGITITLTAGYSSVANMPPEFRDAVKLRVRIRWLLNMGQFDEAEKSEAAYANVIRPIRRDDYA